MLYRKSGREDQLHGCLCVHFHPISSVPGNNQLEISHISYKITLILLPQISLPFHCHNKYYIEGMDQILHLYNIPREIIQNLKYTLGKLDLYFI